MFKLEPIYVSLAFDYVVLANTESRRINVVRTKTTENEYGFFYRILYSIESGLDLADNVVIDQIDKFILTLHNVESVNQLSTELEGFKKAFEEYRNAQ